MEGGSGSGSNKTWKSSCGSAQLKGGSGSDEKIIIKGGSDFHCGIDAPSTDGRSSSCIRP